MSQPRQKDEDEPRRRRYLVHLLCLFDPKMDGCCYVARIRPWTGRHGQSKEMRERTFADDSELIATMNPLLPAGSDIRDVFEHIETPNGFYYLLHLSRDEARELGWDV